MPCGAEDEPGFLRGGVGFGGRVGGGGEVEARVMGEEGAGGEDGWGGGGHLMEKKEWEEWE